MPQSMPSAPVVTTTDKYLALPGREDDPKPDTGAAAIYYADRLDWDPVPLWPIGSHGECLCQYRKCPPTTAGKHPMPQKWQTWSGRTPDQVRRCWDPRSNSARTAPGVGVNLGASGSLLVIDLDTRDAVNAWFNGQFQGYRTLAAKTGRGLHLYFQQDDSYHLLRSVGQGSITRAHGLTGTEVRGIGSFVVAPPSMHRTGVRYEWLDLVPPMVLPDDLRAWIEAAGGRAAAHHRRPDRGSDARGIRSPRGLAVSVLNALSRARPGQRNDQAARAALALADLVAIGWCRPERAEQWFFVAAADCGLLRDEPVKTRALWNRVGPAGGDEGAAA